MLSRRMRWVDVSSKYFLSRNQVEDTGQLQSPVILPHGKEPLEPTEQEVVCKEVGLTMESNKQSEI
jgi:hypothetical protein